MFDTCQIYCDTLTGNSNSSSCLGAEAISSGFTPNQSILNEHFLVLSELKMDDGPLCPTQFVLSVLLMMRRPDHWLEFSSSSNTHKEDLPENGRLNTPRIWSRWNFLKRLIDRSRFNGPKSYSSRQNHTKTKDSSETQMLFFLLCLIKWSLCWHRGVQIASDAQARQGKPVAVYLANGRHTATLDFEA